MTLEARAWLSLLAVGLVMAALVFVPAGTIDYWQAWVYLALFLGAGAAITAYLLATDRELLERRMRGGPTAEQRPTQRLVMLAVSLAFVALLVVPALDHRFGWSRAPVALVLAADALVAAGFLLVGRVFRENSFTSATIEVAEGQTVISTGPYAVVRHPMYAGALLYLLATPVALGSYWGLLPFAIIVVGLLLRILDEERLLASSLPGYREYESRVRYRLVPGLW